MFFQKIWTVQILGIENYALISMSMFHSQVFQVYQILGIALKAYLFKKVWNVKKHD
jgi:hypothetical protein